MANYGELILSKAIETNNVQELAKQGIRKEDFISEVEQEAYDFIVDYAAKNGGKACDYRTLIAHVPQFNFRPNVEDSFKYMVREQKQYLAHWKMHEFLTGEGTAKFENMPGLDYADWLIEQAHRIKDEVAYRVSVGTDVISDRQVFKDEYSRRKEGKSFKLWKSAFPSMPDYLSGNVYAWYGRSGRGKSVLAAVVEPCEAAMQGATVLIWSLEMSKYELMCRIYSYISAKAKMVESIVDGQSHMGGFNTNALQQGALEDDYEEYFDQFLENINTLVAGRIIIRAVDDEDFTSRRVKDLEFDIANSDADVVVVDPIYYMDFEKNHSKTAGGDVAATSKKLRRVAGSMDVVLHLITQAEEVRDDEDEDGNRTLRVPHRSELTKSKQILQDAALTVGMDSCDGQFIVKINKGRSGGEGTKIEGIFLPAIGLVYEPVAENVLAQFGF